MGRKNEEAEGNERHPLRFLIKVAVLSGLIYATSRFVSEKKNEYTDLTESEARAKLIDKVSPKLGDETARDIADQVIPKLKERGLVKPDPMSEVADDLRDAADKVDEAADKVSEAVESLVEDD